MPPFLSDYDEDFFPDTPKCTPPNSKLRDQSHLPQSHTRHAVSVPTEEAESCLRYTPVALPRKRKRGGLLSGLDMNNIIETEAGGMAGGTTEGYMPTSSAPTPSKRTRGHANGTRALQYNGKYHPLDEVLRPSQAAKCRAEHGLNKCEDSDSDGFKDQGDKDSDCDVDGKPQMKKNKTSGVVMFCHGPRRSPRKVNRNALYNANAHPQDLDLAQMDADSTMEYATVDDDDDDDDDDDWVSIASDMPTDKLGKLIISSGDSFVEKLDETYAMDSSVAGEDGNERVIRDIEDTALDGDCSSPLDATSSSSVSIEQTPFVIYEEPLEDQLAKEANAPGPLDYEHDDKENVAPEPVTSQAISNDTTGAHLEPAAVLGAMDDVHDSSMGPYDFMDYSLMFGGATYGVRVPLGILLSIEALEPESGPVGAQNPDHDSDDDLDLTYDHNTQKDHEVFD